MTKEAILTGANSKRSQCCGGDCDNDGRLSAIFSLFNGKNEEIIPILQRIQEEFGFLSEENMYAAARFTRAPESKVFGIATFYAQFRFTPVGRKQIKICRGTACHVKGAGRVQEAFENSLGVKAGQTTDDLEYSLDAVACIGACGLAPCIMIGKQVKAQMTPNSVKKLLDNEGAK